ncbi:hypothetical protein IGB42_03492 [Andreprevotia sp. IGB-42]|uniref:GmrSD restriction endonuclease domain-containing protein n=1 Tax=Andreprevotia sp. IGB-42 TaxID=2497473 RepID=UPI0013589FC0|nr:DUF262 domain-containing protein [Andreprevotia sp. IGB-42]KAF0811950.1 hypothetical protein IGB42_03492 [Andreprevotia sp. IGB-42]
MAQRVTLDAMIPREDFALADEEFTLDLFQNFSISYLLSDSAILKLLRKPDFQRETNHWSPEQVATLIASFLDNEVIPSLILWKSPTYVFVIDGGHRLSALRAWIEDDYGDGALSLAFYKGEISEEQKKVAKRARQVIEQKVGRFSSLRNLSGTKISDDPDALRRANRLFTRALNLQWVQGNADVAETSFFKINSQGTPLDDTEEMLIKNRRKPIAIGARAILRSGTGHKYWSRFSLECREQLEGTANDFYKLLFEPESNLPLKTLDVPFGGSVSPVEALSLLIDFLTVSGARQAEGLTIDKQLDDETGEETIGVLQRSFEIFNRITGNTPGSLGLHPAVYFYNERGKYNRFLFLGMTALITERVRNNDSNFFKKFTRARSAVEQFLVANKSLIALVQQNMSKAQRVPRMKKLFEYLIDTVSSGEILVTEDAIAHLGLRGKILDVNSIHPPLNFSDDTKSMMFVTAALANALKCPICNGYLHPTKSVSYDHIIRRENGGTGEVTNGQMTHPFCNTGMKN